MPKETIMVGFRHATDNMKKYILLLIISGCLMLSCNTATQNVLKNEYSEFYLSEMALIYWDYYYKFPTSYIQSRDTDAYFFTADPFTDSLLVHYNSELTYTNQDTALLITFRGDTLALVQLLCSCDWTDEIPLGPRAYDSQDSIVLNELITAEKDIDGVDSRWQHLNYDQSHKLDPVIEKRMNKKGYVRIDDRERKYPQYLLIEYLSEKDSIRLIKVCQKYSCYLYDDYTEILRDVFSEYCNNNHISRLLTAVAIYLPAAEATIRTNKL